MLPVTLAVFFCFGSYAAGQLHREACNLTVLETCHNNFIEKFGGSAPWYQVEDVRYIVEKQYSTGNFDNVRILCSAYQDFKECFSASSDINRFRDYQACTEIPSTLMFDRDGNQRRQYSKAQIYEYIMLIAQFDYACGAGLSMFTNYGSCISQVFYSSRDVLTACNQAFMERIYHDEENVCSYVDEAIGCYEKEFKSCGQIPGWFGCEYKRTGLAAIYPYCSASCTGRSSTVEL